MPLSDKLNLSVDRDDCPPDVMLDSLVSPIFAGPRDADATDTPRYTPRPILGQGVEDATAIPPLAPVSSTPTNSTFIEDTTMADQVVVPGMDGMGTGGGLIGGLILGSLLRNNGNLLGGNGLDGAGYNAGNGPVLQAMNQQQLASATQIMTQDINRVGHDIATSAGATQAAVAAANLNQTVATLQGQTALTSSIMDSTITNAAGHTNILGAVAGATSDVTAGLNALGNGLTNAIYTTSSDLGGAVHDIATQLGGAIAQTRDDVNRARFDNLEATHRAEVTALQSAYATQKSITDDGDKTRALISNINTADLNRQIVVAENALAEARHDHRQAIASHDIIINNNNNATAVANALAQQQQQQQLAQIGAAVYGLTGHVQNLTQFAFNTGAGSNVGNAGANV